MDPSAAKPDLGDLIAILFSQRRTCHRMSRLALAARLGVHPATIVDWENGDCLPGLPNLIRWAQVFGLRVALLDKHGERTIPGTAPHDGEDWASSQIRWLMAALYDTRRALGLTQAALGKRLGVDGPTILRWEKSRRTPSLLLLTGWSSELGCTLTLLPLTDPDP